MALQALPTELSCCLVAFGFDGFAHGLSTLEHYDGIIRLENDREKGAVQ